jgi:hypothetical protein
MIKKIEEEKPIYRVTKSVNGKWGIKSKYSGKSVTSKWGIRISVFKEKTDYKFMPKTIHRDNQGAYNTRSGGGNSNAIRVPSLKRNDRVWRNFYVLFPSLLGKETYRGLKLKKIK